MKKQDCKSGREAMVGDVFAVKQPDGRYGAIRIAKVQPKLGSYLIITTPYIGMELPAIDNSELSKVLLQNRFFYKNKRALTWIDEKPPESLKYIGHIPLNDEEKNIICNSFCEHWDTIGIEAYLEWRWKNDQDNFIMEVQEEQRIEGEQLHNKFKIKMDDDKFWSIISLLDMESKETDGMVEAAVHALAKMNVKEINEFEETLSLKLYLLDTKSHAKNMGEHSYIEDHPSHFSVDMFLYARCAVIAEGQRYFELTLRNPEKMIKNRTFEPLLTIASEAYAKKRGSKFEYIAGFSYETFSNSEGWS